MNKMAEDISKKIKELNGGKSVNAVFVVGGGGKVVWIICLHHSVHNGQFIIIIEFHTLSIKVNENKTIFLIMKLYINNHLADRTDKVYENFSLKWKELTGTYEDLLEIEEDILAGCLTYKQQVLLW